MYLTDSIETTEHDSYDMVGIISGEVRMHTTVALGYREISGRKGNFLIRGQQNARGHEFHYSTFEADIEIQHAYETKGMRELS